MNVISKMEVASVEDYGVSRKIKFRTVYEKTVVEGGNQENQSFTKATPSGEAWMTVDNKAVWPAFRLPGDASTNYARPSQHYVVFIDAEEYSLEDVYRALAYLKTEEVSS